MTEVRQEKYVLPGADLGPENPQPYFKHPEREFKACILEGIPAEETKLIGWKCGFRVLPFRMQDGYSAQHSEQSFDAVVMENQHLKVTFVPSMGGHLMSMIHKATGEELLDRNPVFQPRNLALRNAWLGGGIEFNAGLLGHHYLTCSPIHACLIEDQNEDPGLRMYAWDRVKRFTYQMDFYLPEQSQLLFMHVSIVNTLSEEIPMYWWTNMTAPEATDRRVLVPADTCIYNAPEGFALGHLPEIDDYNVTYTTNIKHSMEFFFRMEKNQRRWAASLDKEGRGFFQTSTDRLVGRKLFVWGTSQGGNRWQDYLAAPGSAYVEIQAGLTQTQNEHIPMPGNTEWTWTEAFGMLQVDPEKAHNSDWNKAWHDTDKVVDQTLPMDDLNRLHERYDQLMLQPCGRMLSRGLGWGALEKYRAREAGEASTIPEQLDFCEEDMGEEQAAWLELLRNGKLPERSECEEPGQFMVQTEWKELLKKSIDSGAGDHWLSWYHLGIMHVEFEEIGDAVKAFEKSLLCKRTGWALRNLAALELRERRREAARALYKEAWEIGPKNRYLAREYAALLLNLGLNCEVVDLIQSVPEEIREDERLQLTKCFALVRMDDFEDTIALFDRDFVTMAEGEGSLAGLWFEMHERKTALERNAKIDDQLKAEVRKNFPAPAKIDFRVSRDVAERVN